jgi:cell filamentation protein
MKKRGRYSTSGMVEDQYMPGSNGTVLKNLLGITTQVEIDRIETQLLFDVSDQILDEFSREKQFTVADIRLIHQRWLGSLYEWAGRFRRVTISKGDLMFAVPVHIPELMSAFEKEVLMKYTPCIFDSREEVISALAIVHTELILIHPFREGNGRLSRLLATLMALQADLPPLDFADFAGDRQEEYFAAVRNGLDRNYIPMEKVFADVISRSVQAQSI